MKWVAVVLLLAVAVAGGYLAHLTPHVERHHHTGRMPPMGDFERHPQRAGLGRPAPVGGLAGAGRLLACR